MAACPQCGTTMPPGARFCPACGRAADTVAAAPSEERKLATVLFADLVGSTELGGSQDPERTRALLDRFYDAMAEEIALAGGTVEKFAGDAVMAVFGAPAALEDHCERALHAALAMQRRLRTVFVGELALRIGVNTGDVVVGRPREGSSFVTGDAVNVAARLEQAAAPGDVLVGERTAAAVRGAFELSEPSLVEAKGKAGGVAARRLLRALSLTRPRGLRGLPSSFVGRDRDIELLQATYRRVAERAEPHLVTIMGDAGVGKTTLVRRLWEWLDGEQPQPLRRTGRCMPYGQGITYWPLGEILKEHLGILESDDAESMRQRLSGREVLGLTLGLDVAGELHPLTVRERLHEAWVELLASLAAERPTVVLVEDLHSADGDLLDLIERLARDVHGPLFLVGTARPELLDGRPTWGGGRRNASLLWLEPLSADDAGRMLDESLQVALPARVRERIVQQAEGNPFFVEELLGSLIDRGVLEPGARTWTVRAPTDEVDVPDTVQAVLASRIDLLPPTEKAALQAAAVIGRVFWAGPVEQLLGAEPDFGVLEERDFIRRRPGSSLAGEREFAIKHALTREIAYGSLPKARRARLHAAFAEWLESEAGAPDELAPLLAHHYAEAVKPEDADLAWRDDETAVAALRERAVTWLERAGELARSRYEIDDAVALLSQAAALAGDADTGARMWQAVGYAHALRFDGAAFWRAMQRALELAGDPILQAGIYSELAFQTAVRSGMWPSRPEHGLVASWIARALELAPAASAERAKALIARAFWEPAAGLEAAREGSALAEAVGDVGLRSFAWGARSTVAFARGDYRESLTWAQRRADAMEAITDSDHRTEILETLIPPSAMLGRFGEALRLAREHERAAERLTPHHRLHSVAMAIEVHELTGDWAAIRALEQQTVNAVDANLATPCVRNSRSLFVSAAAQAAAGRVERALALEQRALELAAEGYGHRLSAPRIRLALFRGELSTVEALLAADVPNRGHDWMFVSARATLFDALAALRDRDRVEREAGEVLRRPRTYIRPFAARALGVVRHDEALLLEAVADFDALGLDRHADETRALVTA